MSIHAFSPSIVPPLCRHCGKQKSEHEYQPQEPTVSPIREPAAVARRTDPGTSWEAARSVTGIRESQAEVLELFRQHGPMTDEEARSHYHGRQSVSGFRTRRAELVDQRLIRDTGERRRMTTGRRAVVWEAA